MPKPLPIQDTISEDEWLEGEYDDSLAVSVVDTMLQRGLTDDIAQARNFYLIFASSGLMDNMKQPVAIVIKMQALIKNYYALLEAGNDDNEDTFNQTILAMLDNQVQTTEENEDSDMPDENEFTEYEYENTPASHHEAKWIMWANFYMPMPDNSGEADVSITLRQGMTNADIDEMLDRWDYLMATGRVIPKSAGAKNFRENHQEERAAKPQGSKVTPPPQKSQQPPKKNTPPPQPGNAKPTGRTSTPAKPNKGIRMTEQPDSATIWDADEIEARAEKLEKGIKRDEELITVYQLKRLKGKSEGLEFQSWDGTKLAHAWDGSDHNDPKTAFKNPFLSVDDHGELCSALWKLQKGEIMYLAQPIFFKMKGEYIQGKALNAPTTWRTDDPYYGE